MVVAQNGQKEAPAIPRSGSLTLAQKPPAGMTTIWSNLYPNPVSVYSIEGSYVTGPDNSIVGQDEQWVAIPFTPAASGHVEELQLALTIVSGTNLLDVTLAGDDDGDVGSSLGTKTVMNIAAAGTCCTLATVHFKAPGIAVTAETQYWIVATNDEIAPDFTGIWNYTQQAYFTTNPGGAGWEKPTHLHWPAAAVLGTIP